MKGLLKSRIGTDRCSFRPGRPSERVGEIISIRAVRFRPWVLLLRAGVYTSPF